MNNLKISAITPFIALTNKTLLINYVQSLGDPLATLNTRLSYELEVFMRMCDFDKLFLLRNNLSYKPDAIDINGITDRAFKEIYNGFVQEIRDFLQKGASKLTKSRVLKRSIALENFKDRLYYSRGLEYQRDPK